jgi:hypothetical protein
MQPFAKIVDHEHLIRDMSTQAVLNTDTSIVRKHEKRIIELQKEQAREVEINNIKSDLEEIKNLLFTLLKKRE